MFGALRFLLAYLVVLSHLVGSAYVLHFGFYAVRGFFVISGFIITSALNEVYHFDGKRFWINRMLRLLPPYYLICVLTLAAVAWLPDQAGQFLKLWNHPAHTTDLLMNFLVLPLQFTTAQFRALPPYWSVAVEIVMYGLLWLVIARREVYAAIALGAGIVYHVACVDVGWAWDARYFTAPSALLSFSAGALVYFLRQRGVLTLGPGTTACAFVLWLANMIAGGTIFPDSYIFAEGYYIGTCCFAFLVAGLAGRTWPARLAAVDHALGRIAYPTFLLQWLVGFLVAVTLFPGVWRGWELTLVATPALIALACVVAQLHESVVEPLRRRVRNASWPAGAGVPVPSPAGVPSNPPQL